MNDDDENQAETLATSLLQSMIACHEVMVTGMQAGFTRAEALYIAASMMSGGPRVPQGEGYE